MSADDSLKLFVGIISAVGALIGTWAGSVFTRVNEHKKWLRDQKLEVYRESYQASQRWINSILSIKSKMDTLVQELASLKGVTAAGMTKAQQDAHLKRLNDIVERRSAVEVEAQEMQQHITDYGMLPVSLVASRYVEAGVIGVVEALRQVSVATTTGEKDVARRLYQEAQSEMVARFRDDLAIRQPLPLMPFINFQLRTRKKSKRVNTPELQEAS